MIKIQLLYYCSIALFCIECSPGPLLIGEEDVTKQNELWYGYKYNSKYRLKEDMFLRARDTKTPSRLVLVPPRDKTKGVYTLHYSAPLTANEYENNKNDWPNIRGIVRSGTVIQCSKLVKYKTIGYGDSLYIYAIILEGKYSGTEAEISDLSIVGPEHKSGVYLNKPNLKLLSPVRKDKGSDLNY